MRYGANVIDDRTATGTLSASRSKSNGSRLKKLQSKTTSSGGAKKTTSSGGARRTTSKEPILADINKRTRNVRIII
jgi:hypothetical protein